MPKVAAKKKFASKMRSIVSAVKVAQRLEVRTRKLEAALAYHHIWQELVYLLSLIELN